MNDKQTHTRRCDRCGRVGTRGFWTQIRLAPEPNRTLCNNGAACEKRRIKAGDALVSELRTGVVQRGRRYTVFVQGVRVGSFNQLRAAEKWLATVTRPA